MNTRTEKDSLGEKAVPADAYYGIHTARSAENFQFSGERMPIEIVRAIVKLKLACARANHALGLLPADKSKAIVEACRRALAGEFDGQFILEVFQAGSGTSTNMNVNEVVAAVAADILGGPQGARGAVHPHDDVNMGQSTNNVFPSAIRIAAVELAGKLEAALRHLVGELRRKADECSGVTKSGRTHLRDAVPITLGQEFEAWAVAIEKALKRIEFARCKLLKVGIGGNAIGTGLNTKKEFRPVIIRELSLLTGVTWEKPEDGVEATQFLTDFGELSAMLRLLSLDLQKICNDLRLLSSGPRTGFNEIELPAVEPGSSIMPGKVNPSLCEAVNMVCMQVMGFDHAVSLACGAGQLELNTHMPLVGACLVKSLQLLERACATLAEKCVAGIQANREVCARYFETSAGLATVLNPKLGYDRVAELVKESVATGQSLRELALEKKLVSAEELDRILKSSTGPNL